jgi:hypothetical protein
MSCELPAVSDEIRSTVMVLANSDGYELIAHSYSLTAKKKKIFPFGEYDDA